MAITIQRGTSDEAIEAISAALKDYLADHPACEIALYRQNAVSVRIRVVDPEFAGMSKAERSRRVWGYLEELPEEVHSDISMLLLMTPDEKPMSFANFEFDDPSSTDL